VNIDQHSSKSSQGKQFQSKAERKYEEKSAEPWGPPSGDFKENLFGKAPEKPADLMNFGGGGDFPSKNEW